MDKTFTDSQEVTVRVRGVNDLVRFIYFSHKKLGFSKPVLFVNRHKNQCITFIYNQENKQPHGSRTLYYSIGQCKGKPIGYLYNLLPAEKIQTVEDARENFVEDGSFIALIYVKVMEENFLSKITSGENLDLSSFLTKMNKAVNFLEFVRISTYYRMPVFVHKIKENWYYLLDIPSLKIASKNGFRNFSFLYSSGPEPRKGNKLAYFLKYVNESDVVKAHYDFSRNLKPLEYYAPIIYVQNFKKIGL